MLNASYLIRTQVRSGIGLKQGSRRYNSSKASLVESLQERGLVKSITSPNLDTSASSRALSLYCGVDPTAPSLHVGNLLALIPVLHFYIHGHNAFALVGGATGKVGDPAGKNTQREKMANETVSRNVSALTSQLLRFFQNGAAYAQTRGYMSDRMGNVEIVNNADWWSPLKFEDYMRDVCHNVRVPTMLARDSVKNRLSGDGLSLAELIYQTMQGYDFWQLYRNRGVSLQIGGSDQYGNITAGIDLIRRLRAQEGLNTSQDVEIFGLTVPLLTTPSGEKFGKSAGNAIWLDPMLTSPFDLYQYFLRTLDSQIDSYMRLFTLLPLQEIESLVETHLKDPSRRRANRVLAGEVVTLVHGAKALDKINIANQILFPDDFGYATTLLTANAVLEAFDQDPCLRRVERSEVIGARVVSLLRDHGAVRSGKEAQQLISGGAVSVGKYKIVSAKEEVVQDWIVDDKVLLIRIGKNKILIIELLDESA